jgi:hypothetical protein
MREGSLREIFNKTNGHCHFCGDPINFKHRGWSARPEGHWEADHVIQRDKGGPKTAETVYLHARAAIGCIGTVKGIPSANCYCWDSQWMKSRRALRSGCN